MIHFCKINKFIFVLLFFLTACSSVPKYPQDACKIFSEKYFYLKYSREASKKWGVPISSILAVINKESSFKRFAKPKRKKIFKIIPYRRPSSSLGFSQAVNKTWELYKKENICCPKHAPLKKEERGSKTFIVLAVLNIIIVISYIYLLRRLYLLHPQQKKYYYFQFFLK